MTGSTKEKIAQALKNLVLKKYFHKITINDIARECGMTRENFYYHFRDKFDIIRWMLEEEIVAQDTEDFYSWIRGIAYIMNRNRVVYSRIISDVGKDAVYENFHPIIYERIRNLMEEYLDESVWSKRKERIEFLANFYTGAFIEFIFDNTIDKEITDFQQFENNFEFLISNFLPFVRYQKE